MTWPLVILILKILQVNKRMEHENEHFKKFSDIFNQINFEPALMNDQNANAGIIYDHYLDEHQTKELEKSAEILREKIRWSYYALGQISAQKLRLKKSSEKVVFFLL